MSKAGMFLYFLFRTANSSDEGFSFVMWLIFAAIETVVIAGIVGGIAAFFFNKKFEDVFMPTAVVVGILEIIIGLATACS